MLLFQIVPNKMFVKLLLIVSFLYVALAQDAEPIIKTPLGKIRGTIKTSYKGKLFLSFEGIPYAKPPVGALRFIAPQPIEPWKGIWNANTLHDCLQIDVHNKTAHFGEEDCLYINVYVPKEEPKLNVSYNVIVNIHGGGFSSGSGHLFGRPEYIMDRNLILVTFNYRIGAFGFLSTGDNNISGNNGLKDQSLALKWIQSNIVSFGGRANSITLMGCSSGGISVHFHYLSPLSRGLFHRGLSQSGTSLSPWAIDKNPVKKAKFLAEALGCPTTDTIRLTACVKLIPAELLIETIIERKKSTKNVLTLSFFPVVENDVKGAFLTDLPLEMIKEKKLYDVPWIVSNTADEALTYAVKHYKNMNYKVWNRLWSFIVAGILNMVGSDTKQRTEEIKDFYFGRGQALTENNFNRLIQMLSEGIFVAHGEYSAKLQANFSHSPIYYYYFNYTGSISFTEYVTPERPIPGVAHGDDIVHIFPHIVPSAPSSTDLKITEIFLDMLESYSQNSVPKIKNVEWRPTKDFSKLDYLQINSPVDIQMKTTEDLGNWKFWTRIGSINN